MYDVQIDAEMRAQLQALPQARRCLIQSAVHEGDCLLPTLQRLGLLGSVHPINAANVGQRLSPAVIGRFPHLDAIRDYYGEAVALYFAWMQHMARWLAAPALLGIAATALNMLYGMTVNDSAFAPLYSLAVIIWAALLIKFWQRREAALALRWGTLWLDSQFQKRPGFKGRWRKSPVTGKPELHFAGWRRLPRYAVSCAVTAALLGVAFALMVLNLNLQGYIQSASDAFRVPLLARLAAPGNVFDPARPASLLGLAPIAVSSGLIFALNAAYGRVAVWLTDFENHAVAEDHNTSHVVKRFLFEAVNSYIALFYLAFWQLDAAKTRQELQALFTADCLRRLGTEVLLPWVLKRGTHTVRRREIERLKREEREKVAHERALEDTMRGEYDAFDEYIEMALQFGFVTMFAGAMPLAAAIGCAYTLVEMHSDLVKLVHLKRRPPATRVRSIGVWGNVLQVQAWLSILTNCLVFGFASDQVESFLPHLFRKRRWWSSEKVVVDGGGRWLVGTVMVLEHVMVLVCLLLWACIPSEPQHVRDARARRKYLDETEAERAKHLQRLSAIRGSCQLQSSF